MLEAVLGVRIGRFAAAILAVVALASLGLFSASARADGTPDISGSVSSSTTLYGDPVEVTVSASNPLGEPYGYNLSYRVVLPAGVSYAGGGPVVPKQIVDAPGGGETTLLFANTSDLSPGATKTFSFDLQYSDAVYDAGDSFAVKVQAFVNEDPRFVPKFDAQGNPQGPESSSFTGFTPEITGVQTLKAIEVEIDEPSPEGEILRGVHDHQTVYTLKVTNNGVNPTTGTKLDAYVPAGLEFLGCGGAGADNTTNAPTNPGSAEEYPGSGSIQVEPLAGCVEPESVETELVDPDGLGPLPEAIYTHVVWPVGDLANGQTQLFPYRAAVPVRANTNTFSGTRPSAASGEQATNLDNNGGPEVTDETLLRTYAVASGTYQGKTPTLTSDDEVLDRTAEDWVVHKSGSSGTLAQGQTTTWTLLFETSEYKFVDEATVTDTLPDGLCPLGPVNYTSENDPADAECAPTGAEPSAPYAAATENADGTWTLSWDAGSLAKLGHAGISDEFTITFPTRTRTHYQENFEPAGPILAHDGIDNTVTTEGSGLARCTAPGTPDCSTPGPKIDFDGSDGSTIVDASHAEQEAGAPVILKQVSESGTDCQAATYTNEVPVYHPGDRVCWRVRVDFPGTLDTSPQALSDFLPAGTEYVAGSDEPGPQNNVSATIDESGAADGLLTWTVTGSTVPAGGEVFERFIATIAKPSGVIGTGDLLGNLFKFSSENTAEETFPQRAEAEYVLEVPELDLVKGVEEIVRGGSTVDGPNGPNVDDKTVEANDEVTYRVDVSNSGTQDATGVEVWDVLPAEYPCSAIAEISHEGECVEGSPVTRVVWVLPALAAGASEKLTYTATVPSDVGPGRTLVNNAGVAQFGGETNTGELFNYTPADNIDPNNETTPNAPAADDPSNVKTSGATIAKAQTTEVEETGNDKATQATIGEKVKYTLTATVPEGTTLGGSAEITDTVSSTERLSYVTGTAAATLNGVAVPGTFTIDDSGSTPKLVFPADYANAAGSGDDLVVLSFEMVVTNVAANSRTAANLTNQAALKWTDPVAGAKSSPSNTTSAQIVEPLISQTKTDDANPSRVTPGQIVSYTVRTANSNATRVSTAHDLRIVDHVPVGLIPVGLAPGNAPLADGATVPLSGGAVWDADTRTITRTVATLAPNSSNGFTYRVEVEKPAIAGSSLTNKVESTVASLGEAATGRRTSGTGYEASAEDTIRLAGATIAKQVTPQDATIGESVTYELTATIPANVELFDTTVFDALPDGILFDHHVSEECISGCPLANPINRYAQVFPGDGTIHTTWDLGDIPALSQPQVIKFTYVGYVAATTFFGEEVVAGQSFVNTAEIDSNRTNKFEFDEFEVPSPSGFDDRSAPANATVTVAEPDVSIAKEIKVGSGPFGSGPTPAHSNETLTYHLTVTNSGDSPAYDVEVTDQPDAALTEVELESQPGVTVTDGWTQADPDIAWRIDGPIAADGGSVTLTYTAKFVAATSLHDGQQVPNTAAAPHYFGVPKATRDANPTHSFRDYTNGGEDSTEALLDFPTLELEKTTGLSGNPDTGSAEINQEFPWRIVVTNSSPTAGAKEVHVHDILPPNWSYESGSTTLTPGTPQDPIVNVVSGSEQLEWTIPVLGPEQSVVIAFRATPAIGAKTLPGTGAEAHVNRAAVILASDEAGNTENEDGPYGTEPDDATATLAVPQLSVEKTPDGGGATAGEDSSFTIEVSNDGGGIARNVKVKDLLPAGLTYTAGTATAQPTTGFSETAVTAGPGAGQTTIEWSIAQIPANSSVQIELPVKVAEGVADGTTLTNEVGVSSDEEPTPVEDEGSLNVETEADVSIEKTGAAGYTAGENYTWQLRVQNLGPSQAENAVVTDPLPAGTSFVSAESPCTQAAGEVECQLGDLPVGFDQTYDVTVDVDPGTTTSPLSNTATVDTDTDDPAPTNDEDTFGPTAGSLADVWVEKSVAPEIIDRKQQTTFTIVVGNDGPSVARTVTLEDSLPAGLEFVSEDSPDCDVELPPVISCEFGDLPPDATRTFNVTVRGIANGEHTNVATVMTTTPEPENDKPNSDEATVLVGPVADLALEKTGPATVAADGQLTWTLKATNNGEDPATGVEITDPLPAGTVFVSADAGCTLAAGTVVCAIGDLAVGESAERQITVTVPRALADTTVLNSATVDGEEADDEPGNDSDEASTEVGPSADVSIVKTGPARVNANGTLTWTLAVANAGPSTATGVSVEDVLPAGVELTSATATQGSCAGAVECQLGTLPKGAAAQIQVVVHVPTALEGSSLLNSATVTAEEPDPVPENNESKATTVVDPPAPSDYDLAISKTVDGSTKPNVGDTVDYEIAVTNRGPATATGVKIVDTLPASLEFVKATVPAGKCTEKNGVVTCKIASLAAGAKVSARVVARAMQEGTIKNTATVSAAVADADPGNDKSTAKVNATLGETKLRVKKTRIGAGSVSAGDRIKYRIRVTNLGDGPADAVVVCDRLPGKLSFAALSGAELEGGDACWEIDLLAAGASKTFRLAARVDGGVDGGTARNVAYVKSANAPRSQGVAGVRIEDSGPGRAGGVTG